MEDSKSIKACLLGREGRRVGEVTHLGGVTRLSCNLSFHFYHVCMIGGVTHHMLPHLSGVLHLHVNRPLLKAFFSAFPY